jgi:isoleucyl-tRNA synthetase
MLLKEYHKKGWIYKGKDAVPWCPRCGTASSKHDIATEGYKEVSHKALFMQFPLKEDTNTYFLIFTTTPWTVPANVAIAVNENLDYVKIENEGVNYWIAESRLEEIEGNYKILEKIKGKKLKNKEYIMPYSSLEYQKERPHKVVLWELASGEEGTGIVHIAPGCGTEDFQLSKETGLPAVSPLDEAGIYKAGYEEFSLKKYSEVNSMVLDDLEQRRFVYKIKDYKHRYPHCWRCSQELVFRLVDEWYIKCDEKFKNKLIQENKKIKWYPEYGKIRQEDWFNNMGDWLISRKRFWGLPLPIWECECGNFEVIGSLEELKEKSTNRNKVDKLPEIHRPWIDEVKIKCDKCGREAERISDVGDAWLDAGIVPLSTIGPYLDNKKEWESWYPADLISENMPGQFRGWFNSLFWASTMVTGKAPFKALFGYETLKDEKGEEMHKSKGNTIWFDYAVKEIGADPIRLLYCLQDPSQELKFGFNVVKEPKNNLNILFNIRKLLEKENQKKISKAEDEWILSRLNSIVKFTTKEFEDLHPHIATRALQDFWLNDLSRGYIQFVRDRLASGDKEARYVLLKVYTELIKLCSPVIPFITEKIWQDLKEQGIVKEESVHLCDWPKSEVPDKKLEREFESIKKIIEAGLAERSKQGIGLKWPLAKAEIKTEPEIINSKNKIEYALILKQQLNVKEVKLKQGNLKVSLETKITPELEAEGIAREIARKIQSERKKAGLIKKDRIELDIVAEKKHSEKLKQQEIFIKNRTNSSVISISDKTEKKHDNSSEVIIRNISFKIYFSKL